MTTRAQRIKRRNAKREKAYFRMQKLSGAGMIVVGCLTTFAGDEFAFASLVAAAIGGYFMLTSEKVLEDFNEYESEE